MVPRKSSQSMLDSMTPGAMGRQVSFFPDLLKVEAWDSREESTEGNFHLHHGWRHLGDRPSGSYSRRRPSNVNFAAVLPVGVSGDVSLAMRSERRMKYLPKLRIIWACLTALMIIFDNLTIPLMVFTDYRIWTGELIFWILNLPVRLLLLFFFGHGQTMGKCFAALEVPLLTVMIYEWLDESASPLWQSIYMLRILQLPRLYSVTGFARWVRRWFHGSSREVRAVVNILMALLMCTFFLHVLTCAWFAVNPSSSDLHGMSTLDQYRKSAELTLSRLHPSRTFENMQLETQMERLLAVLATGLALLGGSIFTSIVTNDISDIRRVRRMQKEAEYQVSDFFMIYPVSWALELQVKDHLQNNMSRVAPPCKQEMYAMLPDFLYRELCREALTPLLQKHSVLYDITSHHLGFQYDLCVECLVDWNVGAHEMLFSVGRKCEQMLILTSGKIGYCRDKEVEVDQSETTSVCTAKSVGKVPSGATLRTRSSAEGIFDVKLSSPGDWLCEACLWCPWHYLGKAISETRAAFLCLNYHKLLTAANRNKEACRELVVYARHFTSSMQQIPEEQLTDLPFGLQGV